MNNDVRGLLMQAEQVRERGDFKRSLELLGDAVIAAFEEKKEEKLVDALSSQALVYRHLYDKTKAKNYLVLAQHASFGAVELAKNSNDPTLLSIALYNLGKVLESNGELDEALKNYIEAVSQKVDRPAMISEMKTRLAVLEFRNGDKDAMGRFESALSDLKSAEDRDNYALAVWQSGAYMHMADALIDSDKAKAKQLLDEAEKIIASDMRLKLRKEQLAKLKAKLN